MRKPFIAGNWKMNKTVADAVAFVNSVKDGMSQQVETVDSAFCVPAIQIVPIADALKGTSVGVGAQNMHHADSGAYTGELSVSMLKPYCQYVILGHSERRAYFGETDMGVNFKTHTALAHGITPIICVGETDAQNEAGVTNGFVAGQVLSALGGLTGEQVAQCVIAYEPIWAIGTGKSANPESAGGIIKSAVRDTIRRSYGDDVADAIRIQYGGSVKPHNAAEYMAHPDIDGALVGGASLKDSFVELIQNSA